MRCCPDNDAVSCADLRDWSAEFEELTDRISSLFVHPRSRVHSRQYLEGLLAPIERKNGWTIAEHVGEKEPKAMQRFLDLPTGTPTRFGISVATMRWRVSASRAGC
jgi:hypothetical protein